MARHPLLGGSYSARSVIASAQRRINYFPERNPKWALAPVTHYQRPGLVPQLKIGTGPIRQIYRPSTGIGGFITSGSQLWQVDGSWNPSLIGNISHGVNTPTSMIDNGIQGVIVDGSSNGWYWTLTQGAPSFAQIVDPTGLFRGANKVDYLDTYILFNIPGTNLFGSTLSNQVVPFDGLFFAGKTDYPDLLRTLIVNRHELLLFGDIKSETWYDAGNPLFPFAELPGSYIEHGIGTAIYSLASQDISVYWLATNLQGQGMVMRYRGYSTSRISNSAVEYAIQQMALTGTIQDAIGYTFQQNGHVFYVLTFPTGNQTWVFDESMEDPVDAWHQEAWVDSNGGFNRHRGNCAGFINGINVVGDWENNTIYKMDQTAYRDIVNGEISPLTCVATFPHIGAAVGPNGQMIEYDGKRMSINAFIADFEGGTSTRGEISLRWSLDRGKTWGNPILQNAGVLGEYDAQPVWRELGISRYPVFEISHSLDSQAALNGAWVDAKVLGT